MVVPKGKEKSKGHGYPLRKLYTERGSNVYNFVKGASYSLLLFT